jgi:protein-disulfide isomerase
LTSVLGNSSMLRFALVLACGLAASDLEAAQCSELKESTRQALIRLAKFQYGLGSDSAVKVDAETRPDCFIRARVTSANPQDGMAKVFTVSPDQKYAVGDLFDLSKDPAVAAREKQDQFVRQLAPATAPARGNAHAPVTMVVFSDFQCPYCKRAAQMTSQEMAGDPDVKLVFRHFPLPMHDWAEMAAEATACLDRQSNDLFWTAHDFLFREQAHLSRASVVERIENEVKSAAGFDARAFHQCIDSGSARDTVQRDVEFGLENNIHGTPTVFINGVKVNWAGNPDQLRTLVRQASTASEAPTGN